MMKEEKRVQLIIFLFCALGLALHLIGDYNSGFQQDELLHIATGRHPAFGYMEFPPVIGWLSFMQDQFGSGQVFVFHIFSHIASTLIFILTGLTVAELGGKSKAVFIALLCILISPGFGRSQQLFQPVVFSEFFWVLGFYLLVKFVKAPGNKTLFYLTLSLAFGFLTKYDIVFFVAGICSLFFFKHTRFFLLSNRVWKFILLFVVLIAPNVWWQYTHGFPVFQMFSRLYEMQLDELSIGGVIGGIVIALNPLTVFIWLAGLIFMFNGKDKALYRPLAVTVASAIFFLAIAKSKDYYFFSSIIFLIIFGSIWFEQKVLGWRKWLMYPVTALFILTGIFLIPWGIMILPLNNFISIYHIKKKDNHYQIDFDEYYSKQKWINTMTAIKTVYDSLPNPEKQGCLIWGKHYSQAGAVDLFGGDYGLPKTFSYHGSFYLWAPTGPMPATVIAFTNGEAGPDFFQPFFGSVTAVKTIYNPYANFDKDMYQTIYLCKQPKQSFDEMKVLFKNRVFE